MTEYLGNAEEPDSKEIPGFDASPSVIFEEEPQSLWDPLPYFGFLHRVIEGGLGDLRSGDQLLYLKLVRESWGRGRDTVPITRRDLGRNTGLGKRAVEEGLTRLVANGLIRVVSKGHGHIASEYQIFRGLIPPKHDSKLFQKPSVETVLSQLHQDEQSKLLQMARTLEPDRREELESEVRAQFQALGLSPSPIMLRQAFLFKVLETTMYHTIKENHPGFFN